MQLILGGPGCGKTTKLLDILEEEMVNGVDPREVAFLTFTRAAAHEARDRAALRFGLDPEEELPWFRTIHSLAYHRLEMTRDEVMDKRDWTEFGELVGYPLSGNFVSFEDSLPTGPKGMMMLRILEYAATSMITLHEAWHDLGEPVDWFELDWFDKSYARYKEESTKIDFTDMLHRYIAEGEPLDVKVAVIDEAQDLTRSQWKAVHRAFRDAERIYIGGDDDQAIYRWAGADVEYFLNLSNSPQILPVSYRLPKSVHSLVNRIAGRISRRYHKEFLSTGAPGEVERYTEPEWVDLSSGEWLLLARNRFHLSRLEKVARDQGVNYQLRSGSAIDLGHIEAAKIWERLRLGKATDLDTGEVRSLFKALGRTVPLMKENQRYTPAELKLNLNLVWYDALTGINLSDREYYLSCLRRGESFNAEPRVRIETIHGVKGAQADHVMLMTDLTERTHESYLKEPDHEHRVFYVGASRAKKSLHIILPQTGRSYNIP